jgi:hypothetical protein
MHHRSILILFPAVALLGCGPSTPEAKVQERAGIDFNCSAGQITAKPLDAPTMRRFEASGCGREAVYVKTGDDNWTLDAPGRGE